MWGNRYFGKRYFGDRYWGPGSAVPVPVPPVIVGGGAPAGFYGDYRLTQRLTRGEWLRLLYGPDGPTAEQLSERRLDEFLEDDDLMLLMLL